MRIVQLIDSLETGGAEKMAVNYVNALSSRLDFSGIIATRKEGPLVVQIKNPNNYLFINKKYSIDIKALFKFRKFVVANQITHIQAHGSSFFTAICLKILYPKVKIIWHDHYGLSEFLDQRKSLSIQLASFFFSGIISVNYQLKNWAEAKLHCSKLMYLPNFTTNDTSTTKTTFLSGIDGKRILCLANLRPQKNHFLLLDVAKQIHESHPDWTFHCVGKDFEDGYAAKLKSYLVENQIQNVFFYGSKNDIVSIIDQAEVCIFTSNSEGLPVSLLEFGLQSKAVLSTNVGEIQNLIQNNSNGLTVPKDDVIMFTNALRSLLDQKEFRQKLGRNLFETISNTNSEHAIISKYLAWI